ncbi:SAM-dependent methyltransferase [Paenibacillus sp. MWE-103]|uniref:SAM-dependent methyltransferase n=1 Tax=Paenibacillus artemisiicola TaxID=1172618 RepID=A0ABS3W6F0_9BACL|nr:SAM-dependent methyltransferase [Paenibacillus artemisiicola]MBO7743863.1 SAM-dependent methyltransferase [Paenibacillus artemisiicola]
MRRETRLETAILQAIESGGRRGRVMGADASSAASERPAMTFRDYMAMCLYDERDGYYRAGGVRVGRAGDFYTSSAIGTIMGGKLAGYAAKLAGSQGLPVTVVEWGAGTGALGQHMLAAWEAGRPGRSPEAYWLVDGSPAHLAEARRRLGEGTGMAGGPAVKYMTPGEAEAALCASADDRFVVVIANELLDAFPVHRVVLRGGILRELGVAEAAEGEGDGEAFVYAEMALSDDRLEAVLRRDGITLREGQILEVNLAAEAWLADMAARMARGCLVLVDYGHEARELAAPHRMRGTLLCYKEHVARDEPLLDPGGQDMTAHVNFTACMAAAAAAGWERVYYDTQKQFLVDEGVLADFAPHDGTDPFGEAARHNRAIRQLLLSDAMSETFKVLALRK